MDRMGSAQRLSVSAWLRIPWHLRRGRGNPKSKVVDARRISKLYPRERMRYFRYTFEIAHAYLHSSSPLSRCLKKYCVCFNVGAKCDELCRCKGCENREIDDEEEAFFDNVGFENVEEAKSDVMVEQPIKYVNATVEAGLVTTSSISDSSGSCSHQTSSNDALYPPQQVQSSDYYGGESHACTPDNETAGLWAEV